MTKVMFSTMGGSVLAPPGGFHCISLRLGHLILREAGVTAQPKRPTVPSESLRGGSHHLLGGSALLRGVSAAATEE